MIKVEKVCNRRTFDIQDGEIAKKLEEKLNEIVGNGGKIMQILEVGDNYTTNHYTVIYDDRRNKV